MWSSCCLQFRWFRVDIFFSVEKKSVAAMQEQRDVYFTKRNVFSARSSLRLQKIVMKADEERVMALVVGEVGCFMLGFCPCQWGALPSMCRSSLPGWLLGTSPGPKWCWASMASWKGAQGDCYGTHSSEGWELSSRLYVIPLWRLFDRTGGVRSEGWGWSVWMRSCSFSPFLERMRMQVMMITFPSVECLPCVRHCARYLDIYYL